MTSSIGNRMVYETHVGGWGDMTIRSRTVVVQQLPEILSMKQSRVFLREITGCMSAHCPRIILDCSHVRQVSRPLVCTLLCCLEEALKRSGDVKLAAMPATARVILKLSGADRLFAIHDTTADAVNSFRQLPEAGVSREALPVRSRNKQSAA